MALESHCVESEYFLDLETGEVRFLVDEFVADPDDELKELIEEKPDRFLFIDPIPSSVGWQIMADFIEQLPSVKLREKFARAINRSHPFRRFKDALIDYPDIRQQWFAFHDREMLRHAGNWLKDAGLAAELKTRESE